AVEELGWCSGLEREQDLCADWGEPGGQECPDAGRVAGRDLGPERRSRWDEMPSGRGQQAAEASSAVVLVDLDGRLPAVGHSLTEQQHTAVGAPRPDVVPVTQCSCDS